MLQESTYIRDTILDDSGTALDDRRSPMCRERHSYAAHKGEQRHRSTIGNVRTDAIRAQDPGRPESFISPTALEAILLLVPTKLTNT